MTARRSKAVDHCVRSDKFLWAKGYNFQIVFALLNCILFRCLFCKKKHKVKKPFDLKTKRRQKVRDPRARGYRSCLEPNFLAPYAWQRDVTL